MDIEVRARPIKRRVWRLTYPKLPWTLNSERSGGKRGIGGHYGRAGLTEEWRSVFAGLAMAQRVPHLEQAMVIVEQTCRTASLPDICANVGAAKAAIDGIVERGVLDDDDPSHLLFVGYTPPVKTGADSLTLVIFEWNSSLDAPWFAVNGLSVPGQPTPFVPPAKPTSNRSSSLPAMKKTRPLPRSVPR